MSRIDRLRAQTIMRLARLIGVPIDIHNSFFTKGKKDFKMSAYSTGPK